MSIRGQVRSAAGQPLAEARVYYLDSPVAMPDIAALANANGEFELSTPAAGSYTIGAALEGYSSASVTVEAGAQERAEIDIILEPVA